MPRADALDQRPEVITCPAAYSFGGMGQHLAQAIEEVRARGALQCYYALAPAPPADQAARTVGDRLLRIMLRSTPPPLRDSIAWRTCLHTLLFDQWASVKLPRATTLRCFAFSGLRTMRGARRLGYEKLVLEAATSHVDNVARRHALALRRYQLEDTWLHPMMRRRASVEYRMADAIVTASDYTLGTFLEAGISRDRLSVRRLTPQRRFVPPTRGQLEQSRFRIVYVGALTVAKGVPLLLDAFARITDPDAELVLIGSWQTRGMRRFLSERMASDHRIQIAGGDSLPQLHRASLYVHPSYEDGCAYAVLEALATGLPVLVTEDTGAKEYVRSGENGLICPTGDVDALVDRLRWMKDAIAHGALVRHVA